MKYCIAEFEEFFIGLGDELNNWLEIMEFPDTPEGRRSAYDEFKGNIIAKGQLCENPEHHHLNFPEQNINH